MEPQPTSIPIITEEDGDQQSSIMKQEDPTIELPITQQEEQETELTQEIVQTEASRYEHS